jgi:hypothetical protein
VDPIAQDRKVGIFRNNDKTVLSRTGPESVVADLRKFDIENVQARTGAA